jgi:hypothetical protein
VVVTAAPGIEATGNENPVTANDVDPPKVVRNDPVLTVGGNALISNEVAELLTIVHNTLAIVPDLNSLGGARLFKILLII